MHKGGGLDMFSDDAMNAQNALAFLKPTGF